MHQTLNELYNDSCKPKCESYKKITNNITLIDNFFENFELARDFFINREKWKCIPYQGHSKSGYEILLPPWIGKSLMEKYISDNKIMDYEGSYDVVCNFFYYSNSPVWTMSNSNYFPHVDNVENNNILEYVCLINLNTIPVSTKFYTYKNKEYCEKEILIEWNQYTASMVNEIKKYYNKENITGNEVKEFLQNKKDLKINLLRKITYNPNQAIVYPTNLFHSPNVTQEFSNNNPRVILRILFKQKNFKNRNFNYY